VRNSPSFFLLRGYSGYAEPAAFLTFCSNSKELKEVRPDLTVSILPELLRCSPMLSLLFTYRFVFNICANIYQTIFFYIYTNIGGGP